MRIPRIVALTLVAGMVAVALIPASAASPPMLLAHRGGAGLWPENTMTAFTNADALFDGAGVPGWIELDTQFTSDSVLVVIHDATLDRTTDCTGPVVEQPAEVVTQCDADPDPIAVDTVPTLAEVLSAAVAGGWRLAIEIKDIPGEPGFNAPCTALADSLIADVSAAGFPPEDLIVQTFWPLCLDRIESKAPAIATLLLTGSDSINAVTGIATPVPLGFLLTVNAAFATLRAYEYSAPDQDTLDLIGPVVTAAHVLGRKVVVWTVNDPARMAQLAAIGVDGIISDRPDFLITAFDQ